MPVSKQCPPRGSVRVRIPPRWSHGVRSTGYSQFSKNCPPRGSVRSQGDVWLCDQNAAIFDVRMNLCGSCAVISRSRYSVQIRCGPMWAHAVRCAPMWSDVSMRFYVVGCGLMRSGAVRCGAMWSDAVLCGPICGPMWSDAVISHTVVINGVCRPTVTVLCLYILLKFQGDSQSGSSKVRFVLL